MTTLTVGGMTFDGGPSATDHVLEQLSGWFDGTEVRGEQHARPQAHGEFATPGWHAGRSVSAVVSVLCSSDAEAGVARRALSGLLAGGRYEDLRVVEPDGHTTSARVRLGGPTRVRWFPHSQAVQAMVELYAPDPLRYGDPAGVSTRYPTLRGGLRYDLYTDGAGTVLGWLDYGEASDTGRVLLSNPGTADVPVTLQVTGAVDDSGFDVVQVGTDRRLTFEGPVAAGSLLVMDGATGSVLIDGTADRAGRLTWRDWPMVPAGGSVELAFLPRGAYTDAVLTAVSRPGWW